MQGRGRVKLGVALAALCAAQLLAVGTASSAGRSLEVEKPALDQFFPRQKIGVLLHTSKTMRHLTASLDGRDVRNSFVRIRPGLWRGGFGPNKLRIGPNHLLFTSEDRAGNHDYTAQRFVIGERRRNLLSLRAPRRTAGSAVVTARLRSYPDLSFRARLNGKPTRGLFSPNFGRLRVARIGADDGLRFGRNVLEVTAVRRDGVFDVERRTIKVGGDRPLAAAGRDQSGAGLRPLKLDASRSLPAPAGSGGRSSGAADLDYRWEVVRSPRNSAARPADPSAVRTTFRPDRVGTYRLRLTVGERGRRAADETTIREVANVPPIGAPVDTIVYPDTGANSTDTSIAIGDRTYPLGHVVGHRVQAVILDRATLEVLATPTYYDSADEAELLLKRVRSFGPSTLVILAAPNISGDQADPAFQEVVEYLGAPAIRKLASRGAGWSAIGVPESGDGGSSAAGTNPAGSPHSEEGQLTGYLSRDSSGLFTYVAGSAVPFDTAVPGQPPMRNLIRVGGASYESGTLRCGGADGAIQVLVLYAETLALDEDGSQAFTVHGCGEEVAGEELQRLEKTLADVATQSQVGRGAKLVFVQSFGSAAEAAPGAIGKIAPLIERLGGTAAVFASATGTYSLVGQVGIAGFPLTEASSSLTGRPARSTGILEPDRLGAYVPAVSSPTGTTPFDLAAIAFQAAQPWPTGGTPGERAALTYVAEKLDLPKPAARTSCYVPARPDVRSEYCNPELAGRWRGMIGKLRSRARYVPGRGFSEADLRSVVAELAGADGGFSEFAAVQDTWSLVGLLGKPFGAAGGGGAVDLNQLAAQVEKVLQPPKEAETEGFWLEMLSGIEFAGSYLAPGPGETVAGAVSSALGVGATFTNEPSGSPVLGGFRIGADDLSVELEANYAAASGSLDKLGGLVVSDYGKLRALAADPRVALSGETMGEVQGDLELGGREWIYRQLFPSAYEAFRLAPGPRNQTLPESAGLYRCGPGDVASFAGASPDAQYRYDAPAPTLGVLVAKGSKLPEADGEAVLSPTPEMLEPVFRSAVAGDLGQFRPWFWRQAFGFPGPAVKTVSC